MAKGKASLKEGMNQLAPYHLEGAASLSRQRHRNFLQGIKKALEGGKRAAIQASCSLIEKTPHPPPKIRKERCAGKEKGTPLSRGDMPRETKKGVDQKKKIKEDAVLSREEAAKPGRGERKTKISINHKREAAVGGAQTTIDYSWKKRRKRPSKKRSRMRRFAGGKGKNREANRRRVMIRSEKNNRRHSAEEKRPMGTWPEDAKGEVGERD